MYIQIPGHRLNLRKLISDRGCTGEISKKKIFSKPFFSQCNLVDMVCRMNIHQDRF